MRNKIIRFLFIGIILSLSAQELFATHLMGGNLAYEYLGKQANGMFRYRIILKTYTNCGPDSDIPVPENSHQIGVYYHDAANPNANKTRYTIITVTLTDTTRITPSLPNGCTVGSSTCITEGVYTASVDVPQSFDGYHLYHHRCCRNGDIVNLNNPGAQGMAFYAFIPPTLVVNSSPVFSDLPIPYICVNDTTTILNTAIDPDGDQLIFSFVTPYNGGPYPPPLPPPPNPLTWPITPVTYAGGYDKDNPFGPGGYAYINASTGYTEYLSPAMGKYVVAVEIKEYRNGNLVGITRRDLQMLVLNCPVNPAPKVSTTVGTGLTSFIITEGDNLCFNIAFYDELADSLTLTTTGTIFDSTLINPPATINSFVSGDSLVMTTFCWNTVCGLDNALPYLFSVKATDNGCPPKTTNRVFSIQVDPFKGPTVINGNANLCEGDSNVTYTVTNIPGATFNWQITGGTQTSGGTTNTITVRWDTSGAGNVRVTTTSNHGCLSDPVDLPVSIYPKPVVNGGTDQSVCFGDSVQLGGAPTGPANSTYSWSPSSGLSSPTAPNPFAGPADTTTYIVTVTSAAGCKQKDTVTVFVTRINVSAGIDSIVCTGDSIQIGGVPTGPTGSTYLWSPSTGLNDTLRANPTALPPGLTTYLVTVTDTNGCINTDSVTIGLDSVTANAGPDLWICPGDSVALIAGGGTIYLWTPAGTLSNPNSSNPNAGPADTTQYKVTITNARGCVGEDSAIVFVNAKVPADAGNDITICRNDSVMIGGQPTAPNGSTYSWSPVTGLSNPNIANPMASPTATTKYYVTVSNDTCSGLDSVTVFVNQLPTVNAGPDQKLCINDSVQLSGSGGVLYLWTPGLTLNDSTIFNPVATPSDTITYKLTVTDSNGCKKADSMIVTVNPLPVVSAGADAEICIGNTKQLIATGGATYLWTPGLTLNDSTIFNPIASPSDTLTYIVTATDSNGCKNSDSVTVIVNPLPVVNAGADTSVCIGGNTQLTGTGGVIYVWIPGSTLNDSTIFNPLATPSDTITYRLTVTDTNGCVNNDSVTVIVNPLPIADAGANQGLCNGDSVQLTGSGGSVYVWTPGLTLSDSLIFNPVAFPTDTTTYLVTVTDSNGCVNSDSVTVIVNPLPNANAGPDKEICFGDSTQLIGSGGTIYYWTPGLTLSDSLIFNPVANPSDTTLYYLTVTDSKGCKKIDSVSVIVNSLPVVNAGADVEICIGANTQLIASGGIIYQWTPPLGLSDTSIFNPSANPADTTTYIVLVTDSNGCKNSDSVIVTVSPLPVVNAGADSAICLNQTIQLTGTGGIVYSWSPGNSLNDSLIFNPLATPSDTTTYYLTVTDTNGCKNSDSVTVYVKSLPIADAGADPKICSGDSIQLNGSGGVSYLWTPGITLSDSLISNPIAFPTGTTKYYLNVTGSNSCSSSDSVMVSVNSLPVANAGPDQKICINSSTQLIASGGINYLWTPSMGLSDTTINNPLANPTDTITYIVLVIDSNGCKKTDSVNVIVNPLPVVSAGTDVEICIGSNTVLTASGGTTYLWSPAAGLSDTTIFNPLANPTDTTTFIVTATDSNGCKNSDSITVVVNPLPIVNASPDTLLCRGDTVQLNATGGIFFSWSPASTLDNPNISNPNAYPQIKTTYSVIVTDTNGCVNNDSLTIDVFRITASADTTICERDSVMLNVSGGGISYTWSPGTGLNNTNTSNPMSSPNGTITYTVTVVNASGCVETDDVTVYVDIRPVADFKFLILPTCDGLQLTFTNLSINAVSYLWDFGNGITTTEINPVVTFPYGQPYSISLTAYNKLCYDQKIDNRTAGSMGDYVQLAVPNIFTPNSDGFNDDFRSSLSPGFDECSELSVYNRWGTLVFRSDGGKPVWDGKIMAGKRVPEGVYFYIFKMKEYEIKGHVTVRDGK